MSKAWKHNLNTPEPPVRDGSMGHRVSGRVVSLAGGYYAAGRVWPTKAAAEAAAAIEDRSMSSHRRRTPREVRQATRLATLVLERRDAEVLVLAK